jgi:hypothetical protein
MKALEAQDIYRIEHADTTIGMWHTMDETGDQPLVAQLTRQDIAQMPMPDSELHRAEGRQWYSGVPDMASMSYWFTREDMKELFALGFDIFHYICDEWNHLEHETLFTRESVSAKINIKEDIMVTLL